MNHCIKHPELAGKLIDTTEQTTAGVAKVEQMDLSGRLRHPSLSDIIRIRFGTHTHRRCCVGRF